MRLINTPKIGSRVMNLHVQSNLCITTTLGTQNLLPLLTGGRCLEVALRYENWNWDPKIVVAVDKWSWTQVWLYLIRSEKNGYHFFGTEEVCKKLPRITVNLRTSSRKKGHFSVSTHVHKMADKRTTTKTTYTMFKLSFQTYQKNV